MHKDASDPSSQRPRKRAGSSLLLLLLACLAGIATTWCIIAWGSPIQRAGYAPRSVAVVNESSMDTNELTKAIEKTVWGREIDLGVAIASEKEPPPLTRKPDPFTNEPGPHFVDPTDRVTCETTGAVKTQKHFPHLFADGIYPHANALYVCLDPFSGRTEIRFSNFANDYAAQLDTTRLVLANRLTPQSFAAALQRYADQESGVLVVETVPRWAAVFIGVLIGFVVLGALDALRQAIRLRRYGVPRLSRHQRRKLAEQIRERYREASLLLDEMELLTHTTPGDYGPRMMARFTAWRIHYTRLAAELASNDANRPLWARSERIRLTRLDHLSALVIAIAQRMRADVEAIDNETASETTTPIVAVIERALTQANKLASQVSSGGDLLKARTRQLQQALTVAQERPPSDRLLAFDDILGEIAGSVQPVLARYAAENGREHPDRDLFISCAQLAGLEQAEGPQPTVVTVEERTQSTSDVREAAARPARARPPLRTPLTPGILAVAIIFSLTLGSITAAALVHAHAAPTVNDSRGSFAAAPRELGAAALDEEASKEELASPTSVTISDPVGALSHPDVLKKAIAKLGFGGRTAPHIIIATSPERLVGPQDSSTTDILDTQETSLGQIFPAILADTAHSEPDYHILSSYQPLASPLAPDTIVVWMTGVRENGHRQRTGIVTSDQALADIFAHPHIDHPCTSLHQHLETDDPDVAVWNTLVTAAHLSRHWECHKAQPVTVTGTQPVTIGLAVTAVSFIVSLIAFQGGQRLYERRHRRRRQRHDIEEFVTQSNLESDHLELEIIDLCQRHPGYAAHLSQRLHRWQQQHHALLLLSGARGAKPAPIADQQDAANLLRVQQASLWSTRTLLTRSPGWVRLWSREIYVVALLADQLPQATLNRLLRLEASLRDGYVTPEEALVELDELSLRCGAAAAARGMAGVNADVDTSTPGWRFLVNDTDPGRFHLPLWLTGTTRRGRFVRIAAAIAVLILCAVVISPAGLQERKYLWEWGEYYSPIRVAPKAVRVEDPLGLFDADRVRNAAKNGRFGASINVLVTELVTTPFHRTEVIEGGMYRGWLNTVTSDKPYPEPATIAFIVTEEGIDVYPGFGLALTPEAKEILAQAQEKDPTEVLVSLFGTSLITYGGERQEGN